MNPYLNIARQAIEKLYDGKCDIIEYKSNTNPKNNRTNFKKETVLEKQPCKLSFEDINANNETENQSNVITKVKLFIAPELNIKPGSKIIVTQKNRTTEYKNSGEPAVYDTHQEIMLEKFKGWA